MSTDIAKKLQVLYREWCGSNASAVQGLAASGSARQYFRLKGPAGNVIGTWNPDLRENRAFIEFSRHFLKSGLPVPEILKETDDGQAYLQTDLGETTLFSRLDSERTGSDFPPEDIRNLYRKAVEYLPSFQHGPGDSFPFRYCYPRPEFDLQSMLWDLNYFKYYFLKLAKVSFDEQRLEDDFSAFTSFLLNVPRQYFMYRDFQSRNIMIHQGRPWFIDYQGGRKGGLQYDLASLLYDAKADLAEPFRTELLGHYIRSASSVKDFETGEFMKYFDGFVLIRILQAMGAYGFRGYYENKSLFLRSIPYAVGNLETLRIRNRIPVKIPHLEKIIDQIIENPSFRSFVSASSDLTVTIQSFSYMKGIPADKSSNGGGFVFDCRALPNPGRFDEYWTHTGRDFPVIEFLRKEPAVEAFLNHAFAMVDQSVQNYIKRGFTNLQVCFGCTGGQHRSVYCAEEMAKYVSSKYKVRIIVKHDNL